MAGEVGLDGPVAFASLSHGSLPTLGSVSCKVGMITVPAWKLGVRTAVLRYLHGLWLIGPSEVSTGSEVASWLTPLRLGAGEGVIPSTHLRLQTPEVLP